MRTQQSNSSAVRPARLRRARPRLLRRKKPLTANLMNLANLLSFSRIIATVPLAWLIMLNRSWAYLSAFVLFVVVAVSDTLDGRLARRYGWVTNVGIFLDLTADKIYTTAMLVALVTVGLLNPWAAILILVREFVVTGLRSFAAAEGHVIPAGRWGKLKMLVTIVALGWVLLKANFDHGGVLALINPGGVLGWALGLAPLAIWVTVVLTIISGTEYVWGARGLFETKR